MNPIGIPDQVSVGQWSVSICHTGDEYLLEVELFSSNSGTRSHCRF